MIDEINRRLDDYTSCWFKPEPDYEWLERFKLCLTEVGLRPLATIFDNMGVFWKRSLTDEEITLVRKADELASGND